MLQRITTMLGFTTLCAIALNIIIRLLMTSGIIPLSQHTIGAIDVAAAMIGMIYLFCRQRQVGKNSSPEQKQQLQRRSLQIRKSLIAVIIFVLAMLLGVNGIVLFAVATLAVGIFLARPLVKVHQAMSHEQMSFISYILLYMVVFICFAAIELSLLSWLKLFGLL